MIRRALYDEITRYLDSPDALVVTGMRRVGKTTLFQEVYDQLPSQNKLFLDLENPQNRKIFENESYEAIKLTLSALNLDFDQKCYIFLDEIQLVKNIPSVVKYLIDHYAVKFLLTGSASFYLKNLFSESLAGRKFIFELYPLSFSEFLAFKNSNLVLPAKNEALSQPVWNLFAPYYEEYLAFGGFPGVVTRPTVQEKKKALDDVFTSYFQNEVEKLSDFRRVTVVRDLILLLMQRVGSKVSSAKLSRELGVSQATITSYVSFLEQTYFLSLVRPFSHNREVEIRKTPKVYFCDTGLLNQFARLDLGKLLENAVYSSLRQKGDVRYYQKKSGVEIDFILNKSEAFEVKETAGAYDLRNIKKIAADLELSKVNVVTKNYAKAGVTYGFLL